MSADNNIPEFDSMSPEEMIEWMSLSARHQDSNSSDDTDDLDDVLMEPVQSQQPLVYEPPPDNDLEWLENLARAQQKVGFDLSSLTADTQILTTIADDSENTGDNEVISWLQELSGGNIHSDVSINVSESPDDEPLNITNMTDIKKTDESDATSDGPLTSGADPLEWLESLAKRQGAADDELITEASFDIPQPDSIEDPGPGYKEYSLQSPHLPAPPSTDSTQTSVEPGEPEHETIKPETPDDKVATSAEELLEKLAAIETGESTPSDEQDEIQPSNQSPTDWLEELAQGYYAENFTDEEELDDSDEALINEPKPDTPQTHPIPIVGSANQERLSRKDLADPQEWLQDMADDGELNQSHRENEQPIVQDSATLDTADANKIVSFDELAMRVDEEMGQTGDPAETPVPASIGASQVTADNESPLALPHDDLEESRNSWLDSLVTERGQTSPEAKSDEGLPNDWMPLPFDLIPEGEELSEVEAHQADQFVMSMPIQPSSIPDWLHEEDDVLGARHDIFIDNVNNEVYEEQAPQPVSRTSMVMHWLTDVDVPQAAQTNPAESGATAPGSTPAAGAVPDWLNVSDAAPDVSRTQPGEQRNPILDWLSHIQPDDQADAEIPAWILEHKPETDPGTVILDAEPQALVPASQQPATELALSSPIVQRTQPSNALTLDKRETLSSARNMIRLGRIDASLDQYERLIRANQEVPNVVHDLTRIANAQEQRTNPAVYRVLGDGLMREGRLQEALNTYKQALNLL